MTSSVYIIHKELERILYQNKAPFSTKREAELTKTIYALDYELPDAKIKETIDIGMSEEQKLLCKIVN